MPDILENVASIEARYDELTHLLEASALDYQRVAELAKERSDLDPIVSKGHAYRRALQRQEEARALQNSEDEELRQMALTELEETSPQVERLEKEIRALLVPKDPRDD